MIQGSDMQRRKHLPLDEIPEADLSAFRAAYEPGDVFDETSGAGAHLAAGTRKMILTGYRRWLGTMAKDELALPPADRITPERIRSYVEQLSTEVRDTTIALNLGALLCAAKLIDPARDWHWLASIAARIGANATREDRFHLLVPGWLTLDYGIAMMDAAFASPAACKLLGSIQFRDGLLLAVLSLWPIRRRSIAALTIDRHLEFDGEGINILLHPEDTKSKRAESCRLHEELVPYLTRYLSDVRPRFYGSDRHKGLWASRQGCPLNAGGLYDIVRKHTRRGFNKPMGPHDFRRAMATFLAAEEPQLVGLIPGVLQHTNPEVGEQHYNLARSIGASRRHLSVIQQMRDELRLFS
jgi:integrase/recombinase XerD